MKFQERKSLNDNVIQLVDSHKSGKRSTTEPSPRTKHKFWWSTFAQKFCLAEMAIFSDLNWNEPACTCLAMYHRSSRWGAQPTYGLGTSSGWLPASGHCRYRRRSLTKIVARVESCPTASRCWSCCR